MEIKNEYQERRIKAEPQIKEREKMQPKDDQIIEISELALNFLLDQSEGIGYLKAIDVLKESGNEQAVLVLKAAQNKVIGGKDGQKI